MSVALCAEGVHTIRHRSLQDDGEHSFDGDLFVQQLPDGLDLLVSVLIAFDVCQEIHGHILLKLFHRLNQCPELLSDLRELIKSTFTGTTHELIRHQILCIIHHDDLFLCQLHLFDDLRILIGGYRFHVILKRQRLIRHIDHKALVFGNIPK